MMLSKAKLEQWIDVRVELIQQEIDELTEFEYTEKIKLATKELNTYLEMIEALEDGEFDA